MTKIPDMEYLKEKVLVMSLLTVMNIDEMLGRKRLIWVLSLNGIDNHSEGGMTLGTNMTKLFPSSSLLGGDQGTVRG